jgi:hypothetical protein
MAVLCALDILVGGWALLAPMAFHEYFPGGPFRWISPFGAYNMHLIADVGGAYLMMAALLGMALARPERGTSVLALVAVAVQGVLHLGWHLSHLEMITVTGTLNAVGLVVVLAVAVVLPLLLLIPARRLWTAFGEIG